MIKKIIPFIGIFIMLISIASAATVTRTVSDTKDRVTISIDIGTAIPDTGKYALVVSELLPVGYVFNGIDDTNKNLGAFGSVVANKWTATTRKYEVVLLSYVNPAHFTYKLSGSGDGPISGTYVLSLGVEGEEIYDQITGDSCIGICDQCTWDSICDKVDSCGNTRLTDGIVCASGKVCKDGQCVSSPNPPSECDPACEFYESCVDGECVSNTGLLIVLFVGIIAMGMFSQRGRRR